MMKGSLWTMIPTYRVFITKWRVQITFPILMGMKAWWIIQWAIKIIRITKGIRQRLVQSSQEENFRIRRGFQELVIIKKLNQPKLRISRTSIKGKGLSNKKSHNTLRLTFSLIWLMRSKYSLISRDKDKEMLRIIK